MSENWNFSTVKWAFSWNSLNKIQTFEEMSQHSKTITEKDKLNPCLQWIINDSNRCSCSYHDPKIAKALNNFFRTPYVTSKRDGAFWYVNGLNGSVYLKNWVLISPICSMLNHCMFNLWDFRFVNWSISGNFWYDQECVQARYVSAHRLTWSLFMTWLTLLDFQIFNCRFVQLRLDTTNLKTLLKLVWYISSLL